MTMTAAEVSLRLSALMDELADLADELEEDYGIESAAATLDKAYGEIRKARMQIRREQA
ncbi:MAG: hypothetical protein J5494_01580 [Candidatus Methanomethylophilaceae archaeon]|nr:hypothetical protein [Candidatus Methanomethylophilaceae archaeon]